MKQLTLAVASFERYARTDFSPVRRQPLKFVAGLQRHALRLYHIGVRLPRRRRLSFTRTPAAIEGSAAKCAA